MSSSLFGGGSKDIINNSSSSCCSSSSSSSMVSMLMIIMLVLQIWVCCDCRAGAIRILPTTPNDHQVKTESNISLVNKYREGDLIRKYFGGRRAFHFNTTSTTTRTHEKGGFADDKRRVPSCPDPLHN